MNYMDSLGGLYGNQLGNGLGIDSNKERREIYGDSMRDRNQRTINGGPRKHYSGPTWAEILEERERKARKEKPKNMVLYNRPVCSYSLADKTTTEYESLNAFCEDKNLYLNTAYQSLKVRAQYQGYLNWFKDAPIDEVVFKQVLQRSRYKPKSLELFQEEE